MAEQLIDYGVCMGFEPTNQSFAIITNGYFTIRAFMNNGMQVQNGQSYHVYKKGTTYYIGAEVAT
jgi:hypothetical protein